VNVSSSVLSSLKPAVDPVDASAGLAVVQDSPAQHSSELSKDADPDSKMSVPHVPAASAVSSANIKAPSEAPGGVCPICTLSNTALEVSFRFVSQ
jgi:hypothetical protein